MSSLSLAIYLVVAIAIGYGIGYFYTKEKLSEFFNSRQKSLRDSINAKDIELISLKKEFREIKNSIESYKQDIIRLEKALAKQTKKYNNLKVATNLNKDMLREKKADIKELETLLLEIQNDYSLLQKELDEQKVLNQELKINFDKKIETLTQKANDLFMVKGTQELKEAKRVFDTLRDKAINQLKG